MSKYARKKETHHLVTNKDWGVAVEFGGSIPYPKKRLHVYRFDEPSGQMIKGEGYGMLFPTSDKAYRFALRRGYLKYMRRK